MKWNNKGHEFDLKHRNMIEQYTLAEKVFIFGAGKIGKHYGKMMTNLGILQGYIDNNKAGSFLDGKRIISLDDFDKYRTRSIIVVCLAEKWIQQVEEQLNCKGFVRNKDYIFHDEFIEEILPLKMLYEKNLLIMPLCQICVTERCTLKCKKCAHACNLVGKESEDLSIQKVKNSSDSLFLWVDYVDEFILIGGEPLLYKDICLAIEYLGNKYIDKIGRISITTNGSVVPSRELLEVSAKFNVLYRISNYSKQVNRLRQKYFEIKKLFSENNIDYIIFDEDTEWVDYGFETVNNGSKEDVLISIFDKCASPCFEVRENRFYKCVMARSVAQNMKNGAIGQDDYLNLHILNADDGKKVFYEYMMGYSEKGYLDMCRYCRGSDAKNYTIPAGEQ